MGEGYERRAERIKTLEQVVRNILEENNLSYMDATAVLGRAQEHYRQKGIKLLNATNIQEFEKIPRFSDTAQFESSGKSAES